MSFRRVIIPRMKRPRIRRDRSLAIDSMAPAVAHLRNLGATIGEGVFLGFDVYIEPEWASLLTIEDGVALGHRSMLILHDSSMTNVAGYPSRVGRIRLGRQCYIGVQNIILPGVEIGAGTIIGAGSVVTRSIPAGVIAAGNPCKVLRTVDEMKARYDQDMADPNSNIRFWRIPPWRDHLARLSPDEYDAEQKRFLAGFDA